MPHDSLGKEIVRGDRVQWGTRVGRIVAIDPEVCLCTVDFRGMLMTAPANRLEKVESTVAA